MIAALLFIQFMLIAVALPGTPGYPLGTRDFAPLHYDRFALNKEFHLL